MTAAWATRKSTAMVRKNPEGNAGHAVREVGCGVVGDEVARARHRLAASAAILENSCGCKTGRSTMCTKKLLLRTLIVNTTLALIPPFLQLALEHDVSWHRPAGSFGYSLIYAHCIGSLAFPTMPRVWMRQTKKLPFGRAGCCEPRLRSDPHSWWLARVSHFHRHRLDSG